MANQLTHSRPFASPVRVLLVIFLLSACSTPSQPIPPVGQGAKPGFAPEAAVKEQSAEARNIEATTPEKDSIFFSLGSGTVNHSETGKLRIAAKLLKDDKRLFVSLRGHANDNGSSSLNLAVAEVRVENVSRMLKKLGVKSRQIKKQIVGGEMLPNTCRSQECRRKMRCVELIYSKDE